MCYYAVSCTRYDLLCVAESQGNLLFSIWRSHYKVVVDRVDTVEGAQARCQVELGQGATLARITHEEELTMVTGAIASMNLGYEQGIWVGGSPRDEGLVTKWASCEPGRTTGNTNRPLILIRHLSSLATVLGKCVFAI